MGRPRGGSDSAHGVTNTQHAAEVAKRLPLGGVPIDAEEPPIPLSEGEHAMYRILVVSLHPNTASQADAVALALGAKLGARVHGLEPGEKLTGSLATQYFKVLQDFGLTPTSRLRLAKTPSVPPPGANAPQSVEEFYRQQFGQHGSGIEGNA